MRLRRLWCATVGHRWVSCESTVNDDLVAGPLFWLCGRCGTVADRVKHSRSVR